MSWGNLDSAANAATSNGGRYLKLKDGDRFELLFVSPPFQKEVTWPDGRTSVRFVARVYCTSDPSGVQQYEFGAGVAKDLASELRGHDVASTRVMLSRKGSGKTDTRYTVARIGAATDAEVAASKVADDDRAWSLEEDGWWPLEEAGKAVPPKAAPVADDDAPF